MVSKFLTYFTGSPWRIIVISGLASYLVGGIGSLMKAVLLELSGVVWGPLQSELQVCSSASVGDARAVRWFLWSGQFQQQVDRLIACEHKFIFNPDDQTIFSEAMIRVILEQGVDVNAKTQTGRTLSHATALRGSPEAMKLLLEKGAKINVKNNDGNTPLHWAAQDSPEVAKLLIAHGADVNAKNNDGSTPLHWALENRSLGTVKLLLDHGADVNAKERDGSTPLHEAVQSRSFGTVKLLLDHGADVNAKEHNSGTPLHRAVQKRAPVETVQLLLDHGANINATDTAGDTPLDLSGPPNVRTLLRSKGATGTRSQNNPGLHP